MTISATMVKELRERTGAGMMECKKALTETHGDIEKAIELMRKSGMAKADKKAGRVAAEGMIVIQTDAGAQHAALVEVNCETDFVARGDEFKAFAEAVGRQVLTKKPADLDALLAMPSATQPGMTVDEARRAAVAKIGENIGIRRFASFAADGGVLGTYLHGTRIGVVVKLVGGTAEVAKDVAMHVAASRPICVAPDQIPAETLAKEKEIFAAQARESGKPENIIEKMVEGRIKKYYAEVTLVGQPFVKNPDITVEKLLKDAGAKVIAFQRFEVGEGIEKKTENFAAEVMAQVRGG